MGEKVRGRPLAFCVGSKCACALNASRFFVLCAETNHSNAKHIRALINGRIDARERNLAFEAVAVFRSIAHAQSQFLYWEALFRCFCRISCGTLSPTPKRACKKPPFVFSRGVDASSSAYSAFIGSVPRMDALRLH